MDRGGKGKCEDDEADPEKSRWYLGTAIALAARPLASYR